MRLHQVASVHRWCDTCSYNSCCGVSCCGRELHEWEVAHCSAMCRGCTPCSNSGLSHAAVDRRKWCWTLCTVSVICSLLQLTCSIAWYRPLLLLLLPLQGAPLSHRG
jgi:hypothetical protein